MHRSHSPLPFLPGGLFDESEEEEEDEYIEVEGETESKVSCCPTRSL